MNLYSGSNVGSLFARRQLAKATARSGEIYQRLSLGERITNASSDAAGLSLASLLSSQSKVIKKGVQNLNDAISAVNVTTTALDAMISITERLSELTIQSANSSTSSTQRSAMQSEVTALVSEYNRISSSASYNGVNPLSTSFYAQGGYGSQSALLVNTSGGTASISVATTAVSSTTGTTPFSLYGSTLSVDSFEVKAADLNGDTYGDLVVTAPDTGNVSYVLLGNGNGSFRAPVSYYTAAPHGLQLYDVNGDSKVDMVVNEYNGGVGISLGNGDGTFQAQTIYASNLGAGSVSVFLSDLNGDGKVDALVTNESNNKISVFIGNGNGSFSYGVTYETNTAFGYNDFGQIVDINGDNIKDFIIGYNNGVTGGGTVLYGNSNGSFSAPVSIAAMGTRIYEGIVAADLNNDGKVDIVGTHAGGNIIFFGNGNGTFNAGVTLTYTGTAGMWQPFAVDYSNDGKVDLIGYEGGGAKFFYQLGNGDGTFKAPLSIDTGWASGANVVDRGGVLYDLNNDGIKEYIIPSRGANQVKIYGLALTTSTTSPSVTYSSSGALALPTLDVTTQSAATAAQYTVEAYQQLLEYRRGQVSASEASLEVFMSHLQHQTIQLDLAVSRITEIDVASEIAELLRLEIIKQSSTALLAQANQSADNVLELLK